MKKNSPSTCLVLDESADFFDLCEGISERLFKAEAIIAALLTDEKILDNEWPRITREKFGDGLWAISTALEEARAMHGSMHSQYLNERKNLKEKVK